MNYSFEVAKNGEYTCVFNDDKQIKYVYSKYNPSNIKCTWNLEKDVDGYILLSIGLGYEYLKLKKMTNKPIYILEPNDIFKQYIEKHTDLKPKYIETLKVNHQLLVNESIYPFEKNLYNTILQKAINNKKKTIYILESLVIARDCKEVFEDLGFKVVWMTIDDFNKWMKNVIEIPDYFFSVNYMPWLGEVAEKLKRPYISWTVDTPSYTLFLKENLNKKYSYMFHYDAKVVNKLKKRNMKNVFYLPVAANIERLLDIKSGAKKTDVSFLANSCGHNEYRKHISGFLNHKELEEIERIITNQMKTSEFIIEKQLTKELVEKIISTSGMNYLDGLFDVLSVNEIAALLIGRHHSYIERTMMVNRLEQLYNFKVYGDHYWNELNFSSYAGHAEHYLEMPKVFKESKINLNLIRSFVDSGLPMRVFDVLGSGGFLMTNAKEDIHKYFVDGEHLVVFNDFEDLIGKINYYLEHEKEREQIAKNGFELVKKYHTYHIRLRQMFEILAQEGV